MFGVSHDAAGMCRGGTRDGWRRRSLAALDLVQTIRAPICHGQTEAGGSGTLPSRGSRDAAERRIADAVHVASSYVI
ncbi:hypothetical protein [Enterovirga rhinocerotis]|uniref:Uncharacterized protein n=1 Tax=Enterovirga rhinocerotis TaxID=1339210 RepID=A0A4R7C087_9HYPH|nr:hypothetical protein [Enterovirga rhinocerotis]TDR90465.1 hypothetical protein EV668_3316 [Enterovirga rhinocerotis]